MNIYFLPIEFVCPLCNQPVQSRAKDGSRVGCNCLTVDYNGRKLWAELLTSSHPRPS